jgi:hypothetical protein
MKAVKTDKSGGPTIDAAEKDLQKKSSLIS